MKRLFFAALAGTTISALWLSRRYRRDMNAARARVAASARHVITTPWGQIEYAEEGTAPPCLSYRGSIKTASADCSRSAACFPAVA